MATIEQQAPAFEQSDSEAEAIGASENPVGEETVGRVAAEFPNLVAENDIELEEDGKAKASVGASDEPASKQASQNSESVRKNSRKLWPIIGAVATVVILLMLATGVFMRRESKRENRPESAPFAVSKPATLDEIVNKIDVAPGTFRKLIAKVPSPEPVGWRAVESEGESSDPPTNSAAPTSPSEANSPYGGPTIAPSLQLPSPVKARPRISVAPFVAEDATPSYFGDIRDLAYESYEAFIALGEKDINSEEYRKQLAETLQTMKRAYALSLRDPESDRRDELVYILAFLSLKAGHVMEAAIYGEFAARYGDASEGATRDSAFMALAAAQEASSIQWGIANEVGELHQMRAIASLIDAKWPDEPQRDAIWLNLAQRYAAFGKPLDAINAFEQISEESDQYVEAQLGIGFACWKAFLADAAENPRSDGLVGRLQQASKHLDKGVDEKEKGAKKPDLPILSAKLTLAQIARRLGDREAIERWLTQGKFPLIDSITTLKRHPPSQIVVSEAFVKQVFDTLYQFRMDADDTVGAKQALSLLDAALGQQQTSGQADKYFPTLKLQFTKLLDRRSANDEEIATLKNLNEAVDANQAATSVNDQLWIAKSWAEVAQVAENDALASDCYRQAARIAGLVVTHDDFSEASYLGTKKQQALWLQQAGDIQESLDVIIEMLNRSPNVIDLQLQASLNMEEIAVSSDSAVAVRNAIIGTNSDGGESPIWGWAKLAKNLHRLRFSNNGTDVHAQLLRHSQFRLARSRWLLASVADDPADRKTLMDQIRKQLATLSVENSNDNDRVKEWRDAFARLSSGVRPAAEDNET